MPRSTVAKSSVAHRHDRLARRRSSCRSWASAVVTVSRLREPELSQEGAACVSTCSPWRNAATRLGRIRLVLRPFERERSGHRLQAPL